ncbi:MAG: M28 family peptidase [Gemmatimonadales bacterium]|nr:M28 family peptidase [Gemmatimonadota bacterium]MCL4212703.1 M28 family peptidase [Gemmatimonadales bacterium]
MRPLLRFLLVLFALPTGVLAGLSAQTPAAAAAPSAAPAQMPATPRAIREIREADLKRDLFAMASPAMRGREGGTLDELRASVWVADQYQRIGLAPGGADGTWFQWFNIVRTRVSVTSSRATIAAQAMRLYEDVIPLGVVPVEATGAVLWIADPADTTVDVRGRIVATLLRAPAPGAIRQTSYPDRVRYADAAINGTLAPLARRGAAAVLLVANAPVDSAFEAMAVMRQRGSYDVDNATPRAAGGSDRVSPPPVQGAGPTPGFLMRAAMGAALQQAPEVSLAVRLERFETPSVNVIGLLRGTDPVLRDEYVLYSSHQDANGVRLLVPGDSVLAGADDNASVSVAEFAAARAFVAERPKRSLLFVHHGAEERGLLGSRYHSAHPVVPLAQVVAVLNGDMIGRNHPDTAALLGAQPPHRSSTELVQMALQANAATARFVIDTLWDRPTHPEGWFFRSDHLPYARLGVPALMYTTNLHDDYHTAGDIPERIDYAKLTRMAQWMYLTGWYVANAPRRPAVDAGFKLER